MITHFKYIDCHKMIAVQGSSTKDSNNFSWSLLMHIFHRNMLFVSSFVINFWADREFVNFILKIYWGNLLVIYSLRKLKVNLENNFDHAENKIQFNKIQHTIYIRNNMGQKCEGNCGLWVLNEIQPISTQIGLNGLCYLAGNSQTAPMIFFKFSGYVFLRISLRTHKPQLPSHFWPILFLV